MELFESIGLKGDPFTTSPTVELFYPAKEHVQCLEGLELSIRMRRGLSVVRGGIGTGKTTISRKLMQNFNAEKDNFEFYLILDPKFESELVLLQHLTDLFGLKEKGESVQDCRNIIEHHLIEVGIEKGGVLVLIIDEGQNLKGEFLDVFRTLLNFETDEYKLLQLIIFGQPEMGAIIHEYPNFEDRITFDFELGPLDLDSSRGMIEHRLNTAGSGDQKWFTEDAIETIHKHTQGYPRKITKICHQLLLNMINDESEEITQFMVEDAINGKTTTGLIEQEPDEDDIEDTPADESKVAVNKLFDILRQNQETKEAEEEIPEDEDIIGTAAEIEEEIEEEEELYIDEDEIAEAEIKREAPTPDQLKKIGIYPPDITVPLFKKEKVMVGLAVDEGHIYTVVLQESGGKKQFVMADTFTASKAILDPTQDPTGFSVALGKAYEQFIQKAETNNKIKKYMIRKIRSVSTLALSINNDSTILKNVPQIPPDSKDDRKTIIDFNVKQNLPFNPDNIFYQAVELTEGKNIVGVGDIDSSGSITNILLEKKWGIRSWSPVAQAVYNAFRWNYPEKKNDVLLILHVGEVRSLLLGYNQGILEAVIRLDFGIQNLSDAWTQRRKSDSANWYKRDYIRVPPVLIPGKTDVAKIPQDTVMRSVIESWGRELDRTMISLKKDFPIDNISSVYVSGGAKEITYFDEYIETQFGLPTHQLDPLRNIAFFPDEKHREKLDIPSSIITVAIGGALNINKSVNLLPTVYKHSEVFRLGNRIGIPIAAIILICLSTLSAWTVYNHDIMKAELFSIQTQAEQIESVEDKYSAVISRKNAAQEQMYILEDDADLSMRILTVMRFLSHNTPKEITYDIMSFQKGWEEKNWMHIGNSLTQVIETTSDRLKILRLTGVVETNPALKRMIFENFKRKLERSELFNEIVIMKNETKAVQTGGKMSFVLKCVL